MLQSTVQVLNIKSIEMNALIESFAIHARAFLEFFEVKKKQGYCASHFTVSEYQPQFVNKLSKSTIDKLNTQIAHMTGARTSKQEEKLRGEDRAELLEAILNEVTEFKKALKPEFSGVSGASVASVVPAASAPSATNAIQTLGGAED